MSPPITFKTGTKMIIDLVNLYRQGLLNLNPGFQRQSVWSERDRSRLTDSILRNYPLPAIFLYKRHEPGRYVYDVIDGKQRLESIFRFMGVIRGCRFETKTLLPGSDNLERVSWNALKRKGLLPSIFNFEVPIIEIDGELNNIIEVFVRINSTGKALTSQEKRHARYYTSSFLKEAWRLSKRFETYFLENAVFSAGQIHRMKHVELISELMLSLESGGVLNKKATLDRVMAANSMDTARVQKSSQLAVAALNRVGRMFPRLKSTRFRRVTDFYTLAVLIGKFDQACLILTDRRRNRLASDLIDNFGQRVDELRELQRKAKGSGPEQEIFRQYLLTVSEGTDELSHRKRREEILDALLRSIFEEKDGRRGFTAEQRRILWNTTVDRTCSFPGCRSKMTWENFTIDHINPHSKGGRSELANAALMCRRHQAIKGNRSYRTIKLLARAA